MSQAIHTDTSVAVEGLLNHHWLCLLDASSGHAPGPIKHLSLGYGKGPHWSFWFTDTPGVYRLELHGAQPVDGYDWLAEFVVKYYPAPTEACFTDLSIFEQACRLGAAFQCRPAALDTVERGCACHGLHHTPPGARFADLGAETGAPSGRHDGQIPAEFFFAGTLLLAYRQESGSRARWESQDRWRVLLIEDCAVPEADGCPAIRRRKGDLDRDFPGFFMTDRLSRRLLEGWSRFHGYSARMETRCEMAGVEFFSDGQTLVSAPAGGIRRIAVEVECRRAGIGRLPELPC
jgi:hypothetical protein